jgi:hypothetical protein
MSVLQNMAVEQQDLKQESTNIVDIEAMSTSGPEEGIYSWITILPGKQRIHIDVFGESA